MISAIVITKNEEEMIKDCLESLTFCGEIIVVDSGSTDQTINIAREYTDAIFQIKTANFSVMRNFGSKKAKGDWLLYIDADERVSLPLKDEINKKIQNEDIAGCEIHRKNNFLGKWMEHGGWEGEYLLRLMRKDKLIGWMGDLHETAEVSGKIEKIDEPILHYTHRDLFRMVEKTNKWSEIEADLRLRTNHPKMTVPRFIKLFLKDFAQRMFRGGAYKDGVVGVIEAIYQPYSLLMTYFKLWEAQNGSGQTGRSTPAK